MPEQLSGDGANAQPVFDQATQKVDFEKLKDELRKRGIEIEKTVLDKDIPPMTMDEFTKLAGTSGGQLAKNLAADYRDLVRFLTEYYFIIDDFKDKNSQRLQVRDEIAASVETQYGERAKAEIERIYMYNKLRNNVLTNIGPTIEQMIRILRRNPKNDNGADKIQGYLDQVTGENDPQQYEGAERLEKTRQMDNVVQDILVELKNISVTT
jgi:hypothetical protein